MWLTTGLSTRVVHASVITLRYIKEGLRMPAKWHKYSYSAQRTERRFMLFLLILLLCLLTLFSVLSKYGYRTYLVSSRTMEPSLLPGECVVITPLISLNPSQPSRKNSFFTPVRGDLVLLNPVYQNESPFYLRFINSLVSFLTLQKVRPFDKQDSWGENPQIRRVIGFPGDSIYIEDFIVHVKPSGSEHFLTEFELAEQDYDLKINDLPENWKTSLPFSGYLPLTVLASDEYFLMTDNRLNGSDSRVWGPIKKDNIGGKVIFRYWPFSHFGTM